MKCYLYYNIWNKESHIDLILRGINYFIPNDVFIDITFEDLKDLSLKNFHHFNNQQKYLSNHRYTAQETPIKYRMKNINAAIQRFLKTDYDIFITPQDDQFIQDSNFISNIINLYTKEQNVGLVGMRDGFDQTGKNYHSSHFSISSPSFNTKWLKSGEYAQSFFLNDGPLVLHRSTIEKVGVFDTDNFNVFYLEYDYCFRCKNAGLKNFVLGSELLHMKFGNIINSEVYNLEFDYATKDRQALKRKHNW
jgi:hypothetical protein